jgi:hypothetical protein
VVRFGLAHVCSGLDGRVLDGADVIGGVASVRPSPYGCFFARVTQRVEAVRMKRLVLAASIAVAAPSCYGSYGAFNKVHKWNATATHSKIANSLIHFGLWVLPLYELCIAGDFLIFNNVEFFTGDPVFGK